MARINARVSYAVALLLVCGCGNKLLGISASISVAPSALAFGTSPVGAQQTIEVSVTNTGSAQLLINDIKVSSDPNNELSVSALLTTDCTGQSRSGGTTLAPGECARFAAGWLPRAAHAAAGSVEVDSSDPQTPVVTLPVTGSSVSPELQICVLNDDGTVNTANCSNLAATPPVIPTVDFGTGVPGTTLTKKVSLTNQGQSALNFAPAPALSAATPSAFALSGSVPQATLAPGASAQLTLTATPPGSGNLAGALDIDSNDARDPQIAVPLQLSVAACGSSSSANPVATVVASYGQTQTGTFTNFNPATTPSPVVPSDWVTLNASTSTAPVGTPSYTWLLLTQPTGSTAALQGSGAQVLLQTLKAGTYSVSLTVRDSAGCSGSTTVTFSVASGACTSDASCATGTRCCTEDGQCHPIVAENADCDCAHPCPLNEGCFPGTCGKLPQQCRPGCFPGSDSQVPGNCAAINGVQAYCSPLPPSQVTTQNQGGACAPGDGCNVVTQNCPDGPLDPSSDAGPPANPIVPYTCEPASVNATVCFPAGTHPPQSNSPSNTCLGENDTCGSDTAGCTKGYLCTGIEGDPGAGLACSQQCNDPENIGLFGSPTQSPDCPRGQFCTQLFGDGNQILPTGICIPINQ